MDGTQDNSELRKGQVLWLRGIARLQTQVNLNQICIFIIILISFLIRSLKKSYLKED